MKGKSKTQKGITLIALIITIVVLLILAVVAINSITEQNIIGYTENAAKKYNQAVQDENDMLSDYISFLDKNNGGSTSYKAYTIGQEVKVKADVDGNGVKEEHAFYVIKNSSETEDKVLLLAKDCINTSTYLQGSGANPIAFSSTAYWLGGSDDLTETGLPDSTHYAAYAAYQYGFKVGGNGRLMIYEEAYSLYSHADGIVIFDRMGSGIVVWWLGEVEYEDGLWGAIADGSGYIDWSTPMGHFKFDSGDVGVRPVVEISKSKLS